MPNYRIVIEADIEAEDAPAVLRRLSEWIPPALDVKVHRAEVWKQRTVKRLAHGPRRAMNPTEPEAGPVQ